jgi:hypothetical protein
VTRLFGSGDLLRTEDGEVTTLEVLAYEQRAERALHQLLEAKPAPAVEPEQLRQEFERAEDEGRPFDAGQQEAITLALSGASFVSIAGPAGTGKGWASHAMTDLWHQQDRRVIALAVAGRTVQQAKADSGADLAITIDGFRARTERGSFKMRSTDVLLIDEAGMIDHQRYATPLEAAAAAGAVVVQIGDDRQLNPVGPGGLWRIFHELAAEQGLAVELREIHRTKDPAEAQAWTDLRGGRIEEALSWYRDTGQLRLYDTRKELLQGMAAAWWELNRQGTMVLDTSNAERDSLNRIAQAKRIEAGELGAEAFTLTNGREIRVGDRVLTAKHAVYLDAHLNPPGPRIENGTRATVVDLMPAAEPTEDAQHQARQPGTVVLELHEPEGNRIVQVDASIPLELGYARHIQKGQGMTAPDTAPSMDAGLSEGTTQQRLYTMASRSQEGTRLHLLRSELQELDVDVNELDAARVEVQHAEPQLEEMPMVPEPEAGVLRMFGGAQLQPGQVVTFGEALPLREPSGVEQGELGIVRSVHRGGMTWDYGRVELVGRRQVNVYQPDLVEPAAPEIGPEAVLEQPARPDQRDAYSLSNLPLENGQIIARDDVVRFRETEVEGRVIEVARHAENRAWLEIDGEKVPVHTTSNLEIVKTGAEVVAEAAARQVEDATIRETARRAEREGPKRAIGEAKVDAPQASETTREVQHEAKEETRQIEAETKVGDAGLDHVNLSERQPEPGPEVSPAEIRELVPERLRQAAQEAQHEVEVSTVEIGPEIEPQAIQAQLQAEQRAVEHSAGHVEVEHSTEHTAEHQGASR